MALLHLILHALFFCGVLSSPALSQQSSSYPSLVTGCSADGIYAVPDQCVNYFYYCFNGSAIISTCPGDTLFDPITLECTPPDSVSCRPTTPGPTLPPFTCPEDGIFAVPGLCTPSYYICSNGTPSIETCPGDAIFDPVILQCTAPEATLCRTTTSTEPTTTPSLFVCPSDGYFAVPGQCSSNYFICIGGEAYPYTCPGTSLFDPILLICKTPETVSCLTTTTLPSSTTPLTIESTTLPTPTNPVTTEPSTTLMNPFTCPGDGNFAIPGQCSSEFYFCLDGTVYETSCPDNNIFDPVLSTCLPADQATCQNYFQMKPIGSDAFNFECPSDGVHPVPGECTGNYYFCTNGVPYLQVCQNDFIFDPITLRCEPPDQVSCRDESPTTLATTQAGFTCPISEGNFAIPGECSPNYYICVGGTAFLATCPGNALFDPLISKCQNPETVSCLTSSLPPTTASPFTCPSDGSFAIPQECGPDYIMCIGGTPYPVTCPGESIFDPMIGICVAAANASCLNPTTTSSTVTSEPFICPSPNGNFPNINDCNTYYNCVESDPILQLCPPGTVFNPAINQCDFLSNVPECQ